MEVGDTLSITVAEQEKVASVSRMIWEDSRKSIESSNKLVSSLRADKSNFLANPTAINLSVLRANLTSAHQALQRSAWLAMLAEASPDLFSRHKAIWGKVDQWPYEPGFIDSYGAYRFSGIVNDTVLELNEKSLRAQHMITDDAEVILGYHSIDVLLREGPATVFEGSAPLSEAALGDGLGEDLSSEKLINEDLANDKAVVLKAKPSRHLDYLISSESETKESSVSKAVAVGIERRRVILDLAVELLLTDSKHLLAAVSENGLLARQYLGLAPAARIVLVKKSTALWLENRIIPNLLGVDFSSSVPDEILAQLEALVFVVAKLNDSGVYKIPQPFTASELDEFMANGVTGSKESITARLLQLKKQLSVKRLEN